MKELVSRCLKGDKDAQRSLYDKLAPLVISICRRYSENNYNAQDVFQEAFIKIYDKMHQWDSDKGKFEAWVSRVTINTCLAQFKSGNRRESEDVEEISSLQLEEENGISHLGYEEIKKLVEKLPLKQRIVFNLYVIEGYAHKEIAEQLQIDEGTSRSQLIKARRKLQEEYKAVNKILD